MSSSWASRTSTRSARATNAEVGHHRVREPRGADRRGRERDPRADAAGGARQGRDGGARARLPRADREADHRGSRRGAQDRGAGQEEGLTSSASTTRCSTIRRSSARSTRCGPARWARSSRSTSCAAPSTRRTRVGRCRRGTATRATRSATSACTACTLIQELLGPIEDVEASWRSLGGDPNLAFDEWRAIVRCQRGLGQFQLTWNTRADAEPAHHPRHQGRPARGPVRDVPRQARLDAAAQGGRAPGERRSPIRSSR